VCGSGWSFDHGRLSVGAIAVALGISVAAFRLPAPGAPAPRYAAAQLDCAGFRERSRSDLQTYVAGRTRREAVGIDAEWRFRAAPTAGDAVALEAWLDSLSVWRRSEEDSLAPDTDGIIGGRYRGLLSGDGRYRADVRPFVPDPLLEVADLSRALEDLLPRLPPGALAVGETWSDGAGLEIRRLADSAGAPGVERFRLTVRRDVSEASLRGDSLPLKLRQSIREDGTFAWRSADGLLSRERHVTVETYVFAEARVRRPVQARIEQRVVLERIEGSCGAGAVSR
jgi:hypothetical protein